MRRGFTLVEIMTVITIITLITGFMLTEIGRSRARLRDNQRISDLKLIETSLELYRVDVDRGVIPDATYPYPKTIYFDPDQDPVFIFRKYLSSTPTEPVTKLRYIYFAPGCLHPGKGTDNDPTIISPTKVDQLFHPANEIITPKNNDPHCPSGAGWLPYVLYSFLERPQANQTIKSGVTDLAGSDRAVVYSASQPIYKDGNSFVQPILGSSFCLPARAGCPDRSSQ